MKNIFFTGYFIKEKSVMSPELGNNIFVGNSSSFSNNHISVFEKLSKLDLNGRKIITPLSYGNSNYRSTITTLGFKYFKKNFLPIMDLISEKKYEDLMRTSNISIFNHYRGQASGNILKFIYFGCKVFLSIKNPIYDYLLQKNIKVYSIEFDLSQHEINTPLKKYHKSQNRKIMKSIFDKDKIIQNLKSIID